MGKLLLLGRAEWLWWAGGYPKGSWGAGEKFSKWAEIQPGQAAGLAKLPVGGKAQGAEALGGGGGEGTDSVKLTCGYTELCSLTLGLRPAIWTAVCLAFSVLSVFFFLSIFSSTVLN